MSTYAKSFYDPQCRVCRSPFRAEYEKMRLGPKSKSIDEILEYARFRNEDISWSSLRRHLDKFMRYASAEFGSDQAVQAKIRQDIALLDELTEQLKTCRNIVAGLLNQDTTDPKNVQAIKGMLEEARKSLELIWKLRQSLIIEPERKPEDIFQVLLEEFEKLPKEAHPYTDQVMLSLRRRLEELDKEKIAGEA